MFKVFVIVLGVFIGAMLAVIGSWLFAVAYGLGVLTAAVVLQSYFIWGGPKVSKKILTFINYQEEVLESGTYYAVLGGTKVQKSNAVVLLNGDNGHRFVLELPKHSKFQEQLYAVEYKDEYKVRRVALKKEVREDETKKWGDGA